MSAENDTNAVDVRRSQELGLDEKENEMTANGSQKAMGTKEQYSLAKILGIWAIVALPMALLTRVVVPALAPHVRMHPGIL